jgi:hypothetical protein
MPHLLGEAPPLKPIRDLIDQGQRKRDHGGEHEGEETDFHLDVKPGHYEITGSLIGGRVTRSAETWQFIRSVRVPPLERDGTTYTDLFGIADFLMFAGRVSLPGMRTRDRTDDW